MTTETPNYFPAMGYDGKSRWSLKEGTFTYKFHNFNYVVYLIHNTAHGVAFLCENHEDVLYMGEVTKCCKMVEKMCEHSVPFLEKRISYITAETAAHIVETGEDNEYEWDYIEEESNTVWYFMSNDTRYTVVYLPAEEHQFPATFTFSTEPPTANLRNGQNCSTLFHAMRVAENCAQEDFPMGIRGADRR